MNALWRSSHTVRRQCLNNKIPRIRPRYESTSPKSRPSTKASTNPIGTTESTANAIPGPAYFWLDSLSAPLKAFSRYHKKRPYLTQFLSTLVIYLLGDLSAQNLVPGDDEPYSPARTVRSLIIGGLAAIPGYRWFLYLANSFNYSSKVLSIAVKVTVNQICFTPIFNSYFFGMQSLLSGGGLLDIVERIVHTVPTSLINSVKLWPAVTAFNFAFIPLHFRSIFAGVIAIGWQTYLSFLNQKAVKDELLKDATEP